MNLMNRLALALVAGAFLAGTVWAQDHDRNWKNGHVVVVTHVNTHPGMFNAYINDLNGVWRKFMEEQKKDGSVVEYNMYSNGFNREGEPDLILVVTYKDWAAFDRGPDYFDQLSARIAGSSEDMRKKSVDREALRKIGSTFVLQEVKFSN